MQISEKEVNALITLALETAKECHRGQKDKGGHDYILHPMAVAEKCSESPCKVVALLHDVIEDCGETRQSLTQRGFPEWVIEAVWLLTKKGETEEEYFSAIARNPIARLVKLADLSHNSDLTRIANSTDKDLARVKKYQKQMEFLSQMSVGDI